MHSLPREMQPLLLLLACLLCPRLEAAKVIDGHEAQPHSHPYMAFILMNYSMAMCGGFLIHEDFVLTVAHCWDRSILVTLGAHDISKQEESQQVIPVKRAIPHPDYYFTGWEDDIMLLQLGSKAILNNYVKPLKLPASGALVTPGTVCNMAGWGILTVNATSKPTKLHEVDLEVQKDEECLSRYADVYNSTSHMCVGNPALNKTSSVGDSGSPLVCDGEAHGMSSFGHKNRRPPRVYTRISTYVSWIEETMKYYKQQGQD